jgi:magnesium chelatase subunit H
MMRKHISVDNDAPVRLVIVTMDSHLSSALSRAVRAVRRQVPKLSVNMHAADCWTGNAAAVEACRADIASANIIIATMLFLDEHIRAVLPALVARRDHCDAMICLLSAEEVVRLTRIGKFDMSAEPAGAIAWLKRMRGKGANGSNARSQMRMLRQVPKLLRFIPGTAQDVRAYFMTMQYWLAASEENLGNMLRLLVGRYVEGAQTLKAATPVEYPEVGLYHPAALGRIIESIDKLPPERSNGKVGLLILRSYALSSNTAHYDGVIEALGKQGLQAIPAFASGLDQREAIRRYFMEDGRPTVDAVVSLTGFSLVGGPAYNDARAAEEILGEMDVPYIVAHPVEFQTLEQWQEDPRGLLPVEATMMVAIPELDGGISPMTFGGRSNAQGRDMAVHPERAATLAARVARLVALRRRPVSECKIAITLFNFPPNAGAVGTAAYLAAFESLHNTLQAMRDAGYTVDVPATVDDLRDFILGGNSARYGTSANVVARMPVDDHVRRQKWLDEIEAQWGPAPGRQQSDGTSIFILGATFGNVFVGIQPPGGYEGDPMRLLFERGFAPTHAFCAFYRWIDEEFGADAVLHFGTHGSLEFMPGKQAGMSDACWPDRLIGNLPNFYLYASNNPSEGLIAKRRAGATLISYLTPPVAHAGLYRGLLDLKASLDRWRTVSEDSDKARRSALAALVQAQAVTVNLAKAEPPWTEDSEPQIQDLSAQLLELEYTLIPHGLHVVGESLDLDRRTALLDAAGVVDAAERQRLDALLAVDHECGAIIHALRGGYIRPAPGGDLLRTTAVLPTGRNLHGFDPFRIPSAFALKDAALQADRLIARHQTETGSLPETIAMVLWGTDNLKTEGAPIAQVLHLLGVEPRLDSYGRVCGANLLPLETLGRPRIDVVITMSGIFRDLLPLQTKLLAEAALLAASADEPSDRNYVRKHALAFQDEHGGSLEDAALRVFGNAEGAYGSNVNHLVCNSAWNDEAELAETYVKRKGFAYGVEGPPRRHDSVLAHALSGVDVAYQNLDSIEVGITTVDHYFDTLGGISRAVKQARGGIAAAIYIGDQTRGDGTIRTINEQVTLETRTRALNPKWYEALLKHGYEGVREIEAHVTNTFGWSATTGEVAPWVYEKLSETFILDPEMRQRLAALNPIASAKIANRLIEAHELNYWSPGEEMLEALQSAGDELDDRIEGVGLGVAA